MLRVPTYRLLSQHGVEIEVFSAEGDHEACTHGHEIASAHAVWHGVVRARRVYSLERCHGDGWRFAASWVPRCVPPRRGPDPGLSLLLARLPRQRSHEPQAFPAADGSLSRRANDEADQDRDRQ